VEQQEAERQFTAFFAETLTFAPQSIKNPPTLASQW
jgi:hypothetical protein